MPELLGNIHMHTPYSDGAKWHHEIAELAIDSDLDFVITTDHNVWVDGVQGYFENERGKVLLIVGEEIHDQRRNPQANHFLALGAEKELSPYATNPQDLIHETKEAGGFGFLAHPNDPAAPSIGEGSLRWEDWEIQGYDGLEIWNYMSEFKGLIGSKFRTLQVALKPDKYIVGPDPKTLEKWDHLLTQGKHIAAIGGSDAHGLTYSMGPISRTIFPYDYLFNTVNTHLLSNSELSGDPEKDKRIILNGIGNGRSYIGYDLIRNTAGFKFSAQGKMKGSMGDQIQLKNTETLLVKTPTECRIRLIWKGTTLEEVTKEKNLAYNPTEPGPYRVECYLTYKGKERGWIFSNPIYLI